MSSYHSIVSLSKIVAGASFVILGVGIFMMPSHEEKIRKMKERQNELKFKSDNPVQYEEKRKSLPFNIVSQENKSSQNEKSSSINVFKDL